MRASKEFLCSKSFGEFPKLPNTPEVVGFGKRLRSFMASAFNRLNGSMFKLQAAVVKIKVLAAQVPNGSRVNPVLVAVKPLTGSAAPLVTKRVVAGS